MQTPWLLNPEKSKIEFKVKHLVFSRVTGHFDSFEGHLVWDPENPINCTTTASIQIESVKTGDSARDQHLKGPDFFDAVRFPRITFNSKKFEFEGSKRFTLEGDLTLHGVTRSLRIQGEGPDRSGKIENLISRLNFQAQTKLNRKDFGLEWNAAIEAGGVLVGDEIEIKLEVEFIQDSNPIKAS